MRITKCSNSKGHYFNTSNICIYCNFDYNEVSKSVQELNKYLKERDKKNG